MILMLLQFCLRCPHGPPRRAPAHLRRDRRRGQPRGRGAAAARHPVGHQPAPQRHGAPHRVRAAAAHAAHRGDRGRRRGAAGRAPVGAHRRRRRARTLGRTDGRHRDPAGGERRLARDLGRAGARPGGARDRRALRGAARRRDRLDRAAAPRRGDGGPHLDQGGGARVQLDAGGRGSLPRRGGAGVRCGALRRRAHRRGAAPRPAYRVRSARRLAPGNFISFFGPKHERQAPELGAHAAAADGHAVLLEQRGEEDGPGGERDEHGDRRRRHLDDAAEHGARHPVAVGDRLHGGADRERVQVVVDEQHDGEQPGRDERAAARVHEALGPQREVAHGAGGVEHGDQHAEERDDEQQPLHRLVVHRGAEVADPRIDEAEAAEQQRADDGAAEEREQGAAGEDRHEQDRDDRQEGESGVLHLRVFRSGYSARAAEVGVPDLVTGDQCGILLPDREIGVGALADHAEVVVALREGGAAGVAVERLERGEALLGLVHVRVAVAGRAAQHRPREANAGVELGDRPVGAERERGACAQHRSRVPRLLRALRAEALRPGIAAVGDPPLACA
ncbi:hypothetical protein CRE_08621 [Caenorhabditis remanei]|uniref:Uncharacterized protein n=1 Tax=Caenorhabditis remanei TaxID=31234 RepID=E3NVW5_CAERE|nr:hypothetical protein CRE_08621 [Caenorhabditis remanei]